MPEPYEGKVSEKEVAAFIAGYGRALEVADYVHDKNDILTDVSMIGELEFELRNWVKEIG